MYMYSKVNIKKNSKLLFPSMGEKTQTFIDPNGQ